MTPTLSTNGLIPASEFPAALYEGVHEKVLSKWTGHAQYEHYAGAWNALAYRFHGAFDAADSFNDSLIKHGPSPEPPDRYWQEQTLFGLFSNGFSTFESYFYAMFGIGAFITAGNFPLSTAKDQQKVSPSQTVAAYKAVFPGDPIVAEFDKLFADPIYQEWREIRNVLTHRTAPGRLMFASIGADDSPPVEWKLKGIIFDPTFAPTRKAELAKTLGSLVAAADAFVGGMI